MNLKYKIENDNFIIYNELDEVVMLIDSEKEEVLKKIDVIASCNSEIKKSKLIIGKLETKSKYSSIIVIICSILTSICLFFNNPLNLGLLALTLTGGSLIAFFAFEDEKQQKKKLIDFYQKRKKITEDDLNNFLRQKYNSLNIEKDNEDNIKARYIKEPDDLEKRKYGFVYLSKQNELESFNKDLLLSSFKVKRMVKHK